MKKAVFTYLHSYSQIPLKINRIIVSAFLHTNNLSQIKNEQLRPYLINENDDDFDNLVEFLQIHESFDFEDLIELFEFVISPEDKIINGAIYTPKYIREYITNQTFNEFENLEEIKICDPACGCAGFLYTASKELKRKTDLTYYSIFENNIFGLDIEQFSIERSRLLLLLLAVSNGEDEINFIFNFYRGNSLSFNWNENIELFNGFDIVLGNPPYVCSRNMDDESLALIDNWSVSKSGHPDLYIPFFQLGIEMLSPNGILGYITVNTFIKSINGRALREYFSQGNIDLKIINFGGEQVFKNRSTYTCICFISNSIGNVKYKKTVSTCLAELNNSSFMNFDYATLHNHDGWNLVGTTKQSEYINQIELTGTPLKDLYQTRNGIATLKNNVYKFFPVRENDDYYTLRTKQGNEYQIERGICRDIVNPNKVRSREELQNNNEKIIFPYNHINEQVLILNEEEFQRDFPSAYTYLLEQKDILKTRDKGNKEYEKWYAYGRRQSLDINAYKLFFPHLSERPTFTISEDRDLLFYSGIAVISESLRELQVLKRILESDVFFDYIKNITKDYSSGYISMSKNYIKNFGICKLTEIEKNELLESEEPEDLIRRLYNLKDKTSSKLLIEV